MADRIDLVIFGATGFTGKHAIEYVYKFSKAEGRSLTWGVAGRSEQKLKEILDEQAKILEADFSQIPIIEADIKDEESLKRMAQRAKIIINCCGPYRFYGEPVVKACVENGTHQVDVSGEPQYIEKMQLEYHKAAQEKGVYIISTCGFDSIPADLGVVFLQQKFEGTLNSVESYLEAWIEGPSLPGASINYGTWESAVYGLAHADELRELRSKLYPERLPKFKPPLKPRPAIHKSPVLQRWSVPFMGSDRSVVLRSQRFFFENEKKRPVQMQTYLSMPSLFYIILLAVFGGLFGLLAKCKFGRTLLLKYPRFFSYGQFSREGPSEEKVKKTHFSITFYGEGWKDKLSEPTDEYKEPVNKAIVGRVKGVNPGYGATCIAVTLAAIVVITETDKLPDKGGVYPPGAAFAKTTLIDQLNKNGLTFEILSTKDL